MNGCTTYLPGSGDPLAVPPILEASDYEGSCHDDDGDGDDDNADDYGDDDSDDDENDHNHHLNHHYHHHYTHYYKKMRW